MRPAPAEQAGRFGALPHKTLPPRDLGIDPQRAVELKAITVSKNGLTLDFAAPDSYAVRGACFVRTASLRRKPPGRQQGIFHARSLGCPEHQFFSLSWGGGTHQGDLHHAPYT